MTKTKIPDFNASKVEPINQVSVTGVAVIQKYLKTLPIGPGVYRMVFIQNRGDGSKAYLHVGQALKP